MATEILLTNCPSCGTANRIPLSRLGQKGRCGRCKTELSGSLYAEAPVQITEAQFDAVTRTSNVPVLVDFWAEWCAPCRQLAPILDQLAKDLSGRLLVVKLDTERASIVPMRFAVQAIPTLVLLRSGLEVDRITGLLPAAAIRQRVERYI